MCVCAWNRSFHIGTLYYVYMKAEKQYKKIISDRLIGAGKRHIEPHFPLFAGVCVCCGCVCPLSNTLRCAVMSCRFNKLFSFFFIFSSKERREKHLSFALTALASNQQYFLRWSSPMGSVTVNSINAFERFQFLSFFPAESGIEIYITLFNRCTWFFNFRIKSWILF